MRRLLLAVALIILIYIFFARAQSSLMVFIDNASSVFMGTETYMTREAVVNFYNSQKRTSNDTTLTPESDIEIRSTYINNDSTKDVIAIAREDAMCGTGGCLAALFVRTDGKLKPVTFEYAVKEIESLPNITNGMHDIRINEKTIVRWTGEGYVADY